MVGKGYAYHHSGVPADDRGTIEHGFLTGAIQILCATSTLAHGINLPAYLVIIRGTNMWQGSQKGYQKLNRSTVMQMCGRAGRPNFDTRGVAVIMTSSSDKPLYDDIVSKSEIVESNLLGILTEVICAEITQTVITDIADAIGWLNNTFFYVRVHKNPEHYGFSSALSKDELEDQLRELCLSSIKSLAEAGIINLGDMGFVITPQPEANIMTQNMISFQTMLMIMQIPSVCGIEKLLHELSLAGEAQRAVTRNQKTPLFEMHKQSRFSSKLKIKEPSHKTFTLLCAAIER